MWKKIAACFLFCNVLLFSTFCLAKEPTNLAIVKQSLVRYHDSGAYEKDINTVVIQAMRYLKMRLANPSSLKNKKPVVVLDIDETSLSNYADIIRLDFGGTFEDIRQDEDKGLDPAISPVLRLYQYAKEHHVAVIFLTGRQEDERDVTIENLKLAGYNNWDALILRPTIYKTAPAAVYKTAMRKQIISQGYDILLSMGDQKSDLVGGYADKTFKLPNPYYFIP